MHPGQLGHALGCLQNRLVAGASTQVARQILLRQRACDGPPLGHMVLVHAKQAHHKTGCAKTALAGVTLHHGPLRRVQAAIRRQQILRGPQRLALDGMRQPDAAVHRAVLQAATVVLAQHHSAGAAIALVAALFGVGAMQVLAQHLQQGAVGRHVMQGDSLASADKLQRSGGHRRFLMA